MWLTSSPGLLGPRLQRLLALGALLGTMACTAPNTAYDPSCPDCPGTPDLSGLAGADLSGPAPEPDLTSPGPTADLSGPRQRQITVSIPARLSGRSVGRF